MSKKVYILSKICSLARFPTILHDPRLAAESLLICHRAIVFSNLQSPLNWLIRDRDRQSPAILGDPSTQRVSDPQHRQIIHIPSILLPEFLSPRRFLVLSHSEQFSERMLFSVLGTPFSDFGLSHP
jgi:hypothetical protein